MNRKVMYDLLFRSGSKTLMDLANDPKHLGAKIGVIGILNTWGQNLMNHSHIHCIVTGGGLSSLRLFNWLPIRVFLKSLLFLCHLLPIVSGAFIQRRHMRFQKRPSEKINEWGIVWQRGVDGNISHAKPLRRKGTKNIRQLQKKAWPVKWPCLFSACD